MKRNTPYRRSSLAGFTLLELLIVIGIIALLAGISFTVIGTMLTNAKETATKATIHKIAGLLNDQIGGFERAYDPDSVKFKTLAGNFRGNGTYALTNDRTASGIIAKKAAFQRTFPQNIFEAAGFDRTAGTPGAPGDDIDVFQEWLADAGSPGPPIRPAASAASPANSSELLYLAMTQGKVLGATPVSESDFRSAEVGDTDGDGYKEFVDAWGNPLRFYRWPTRLINPFGQMYTQLNNAVAVGASTIRFRAGFDDFSTLPYPFNVVVGTEIMTVTGRSGANYNVLRGQLGTNEANHANRAGVKIAPFANVTSILLGTINSSTLAHDADDPTGALSRRNAAGALTNIIDVTSTAFPSGDPRVDFELLFHTLDSYATPLIVSAGEDGALGLVEPGPTGGMGTNEPGNLWVPSAATTIQAWRWGGLAQPDTKDGTDFSVLSNPGASPLGDNITNYNSAP